MNKQEVQPPALLLAENDPMVRRFIAGALRQHGYVTLEAMSGTHAVACASSYDGEIPLAILDIMMPSFGGLDVANQLRSERPQTDFLYVSGNSLSVSVQSLMTASPDRVLLKPFTATTLLDRVRRLLAFHTHSLVRRIIDAGDRLNGAIAAEEALLRLVEQCPENIDLFNRWQDARRGVERAHREYDDCVRKTADDPPFNLADLEE